MARLYFLKIINLAKNYFDLQHGHTDFYDIQLETHLISSLFNSLFCLTLITSRRRQN